MKSESGFTAMSADEFGAWLSSQKVTRTINRVQLHHTYQPDYKAWNGKPDAFYWQKSMKNYHVNTNGWTDIAQQFTICPDGTIITGRSLNSAPAGITGANTGAICIENLGNFDRGADSMSTVQKTAIATAVAELLKRFGIDSSKVTYHAWWGADGSNLGDYIAGKSAKTCPGTAFFGGNTKAAYEKNLKPLIDNYEKGGLSVTQYEELKSLIADKDKIINIMGEEIEELKAQSPENDMIYNYIDDNMPSWAREAVSWCVKNGIIQGTGTGLGLDYRDLKWCTMLFRAFAA